MKIIRTFISSPSDVAEERDRGNNSRMSVERIDIGVPPGSHVGNILPGVIGFQPERIIAGPQRGLKIRVPIVPALVPGVLSPSGVRTA
jgi:hypothetical protein